MMIILRLNPLPGLIIKPLLRILNPSFLIISGILNLLPNWSFLPGSLLGKLYLLKIKFRKISLNLNGDCPFCQSCLENMNHLFKDYKFAISTWSNSNYNCPTPWTLIMGSLFGLNISGSSEPLIINFSIILLKKSFLSVGQCGIIVMKFF